MCEQSLLNTFLCFHKHSACLTPIDEAWRIGFVLPDSLVTLLGEGYPSLFIREGSFRFPSRSLHSLLYESYFACRRGNIHSLGKESGTLSLLSVLLVRSL